MDYRSAERIWQAIVASRLEKLKDDLVKKGVRYARLRVDWQLAEPEQRVAMDATRTSAHNALIDACNILSRNMDKAGEEIEWRRELGDERKRIGDFACHLHALLGIAAR